MLHVVCSYSDNEDIFQETCLSIKEVVRLVISVAVMISALLHEVVKENRKQVLKRMMTVVVELALLVLLLQQCKNGTCSLFQAASTVVRQA